MEADLGFADAYINGDFSFVDKDKGLVNVMMVKYIFPMLLYQLLYYHDTKDSFVLRD